LKAIRRVKNILNSLLYNQFNRLSRKDIHYTEPGDIVFDGFCGTGMTGARW